jgi:negative regulator of sigma E activity
MTEQKKTLEDEDLRALLRQGTPDRFSPSFNVRVLDAVAAEARPAGTARAPARSSGVPDFADMLARVFWRMAPAAAAACLMLAAYNVSVSGNSGFGAPASLLDAVFSIPPVSEDAITGF